MMSANEPSNERHPPVKPTIQVQWIDHVTAAVRCFVCGYVATMSAAGGSYWEQHHHERCSFR